MSLQSAFSNYTEAVRAIKDAILQSRYRAARSINHEALSLDYYIGKYISEHSRGQWGTGALAIIAKQLQQELPGLRGFSEGNMRKMRIFYDEWKNVFEDNRALPTHEIRPLTTDESRNLQLLTDNEQLKIRTLSTHELTEEQLQHFLSVPFTHHYEIIKKTTFLQERLYYIERAAKEFWSVEKLQYNLREDLYHKQASMPNNFARTITQEEQQRRALQAFRNEYLLDFLTIDDPDAYDEKRVEDAIVHNIRKFIMALGGEFSFMGNQYRLVVDEKEYFIDLLFYHRRLQSLVAIELKYGDFKPEYVGKLNFYLSALDDMVRLPNENPSIGVILCRGKSKKTVEYALRDTTKPMGVATYKAANELPAEYSQALQAIEHLKELI